MSLERPVPIKPILKVEQGLPQFLDGVESPHPQELLLQCPDEPLGHAVAFRRPDVGAGLDSQEAELLLEGMAHVLRAMIVAQYQAAGHTRFQFTEVLPDPLVDRLQGLEACPGTGGMDAHHVTDEVVYGHEHRGRPFQTGMNLGGIGAPHAVRALRDEGAVVDPGATDVAHSVRRLQAMFPHQTPHPLFRHWNTPEPEPRPHLAVALAPKAQGLSPPMLTVRMTPV